MPLPVMASEPAATRRRVFFQVVGTDGITPATAEAGGQPQISADGAAWTGVGIGTLTAVGNGRYYADLTTGAVAVVGTRVETRYKSGSTAECPGDTVVVVTPNPYAAPKLAADGLDAVQVEPGINARQALSPILAHAAGNDTYNPATGAVSIKAAGDPATERIAAGTSVTGRTVTALNPPA